MAIEEVLVPRTSDAMSEAVLSSWAVASGDDVSAGDVIAEVETDKALVEVTAPASGIVVAAAEAGRQLQVGSALAYLLTGDDVAAYRSGSLTLGRSESADDPPSATPPSGVDHPQVAEGETPRQRTQARDQPLPADRIFASPLARRMAVEAGLTLGQLHPGTGPGGRIVRADVAAALAKATDEFATESEWTPRQRAQLTAVSAAKPGVPHFYLFREVGIGAITSLRQQWRSSGSTPPSITAFLVKAVAGAIRDVPVAALTWRDGRRIRQENPGIGVAVADGDLDIVVPVVRGADRMTVTEVDDLIDQLARSVRDRTLRHDATTGAVITISNLGMYDVDAVLPIIPPGQSAILGVGRARSVPRGSGAHGLQFQEVVTLGYAGDHRVLTGVAGARFLGRVEQLLSAPVTLVLPLTATKDGD